MIMSRWKWKSWLKAGEAGFTLVELMIAVVISGLVMVAVATVYQIQSKSYSVQDDVANMQQDLRGALIILPMEIRLAGCDPRETHLPTIGVLTATRANFRFTMDTKNNPAAGPRQNIPDGLVTGDEDIAYTLNGDINGDGIVDNGGAPWTWGNTHNLGRQIGNAGGFQPLADNIEALEFNYILDDGTTSLTPSDLNKIRAVQVSILARSANSEQGYLRSRIVNTVNPITYSTASGVVWNPPDDNFRRRLVEITIQCRNMGL